MRLSSATHPLPTRDRAGLGIFQLCLLAALMALTSLSTDVYLPAVPQMHLDLNGNVELTITGFLIGFAIAQLAWGPISDRLGRRIPLMVGVGLFVIGSVMCALSDTILQLIAWRVVQAVGACTGPMIARAMVRDLYQRSEAAHVLSTLTVIMAAAPIIGPIVGGQMLKFTTWHIIFWTLAAVGALLLLSLRWLNETHAPGRRATTSLWASFSDYGSLVRNRRFMKPVLSVMFFYMGAYAFIAGSPVVYIRHFGIPAEHYGWLFGVNIVGVMLLSLLNRSLVRRFPLEALLRASTLVASAAMVIALAMWLAGIDALLAVAVPIFAFMAMNGIVAASATASALDEVPNLAGSASALLGALQYGSGIVPSALLAWRSDGSPAAMLWIMCVASVLSAAAAWLRPTPAPIASNVPPIKKPEVLGTGES